MASESNLAPASEPEGDANAPEKGQFQYKLGPLTVNLRVLLEPKGFLRIILLFVALLAFALTAGFHSSGDSNSVTCTSNQTGLPNYTAAVDFTYPYTINSYSARVLTSDNFTNNNTQCRGAGSMNVLLASSAQFFVAMGVLTMIYAGGAIVVYMLFITPELYLAKWIVIGDLFGTLLFGLLYTIASLAWSVGAAELNTYVASLLNNYAANCLVCSASLGLINARTQSFTQLVISAIFGWLASFIWLASLWFVYKDTVWHKDASGPLAALYEHQANKKASKEGQDERGEGEGDQ
ncbi:synaptophysin-like protein 1 [Halichondria panicea]|uniref:synaptophysin-like protein 1 n=1 Tax=Halichondria panicea TaxID=6063 RepID=UPI00312B9215